MSSIANVSKSILIFGATGTIGKPITRVLISNKDLYTRLVVFTSSDSEEPKKSLLEEWKSQGVEVIVGDIANEQQVLEAYEGIDTVVCALGRSAILPQIQLIALADTHAAVNRFIPSEFGTDVEHDSSSATEKPHQAKIKVRAAMRASKNLDYTFVVTGPYSDLYFGKSSVDDLGTFDVKNKKAIVIGTGDEKISFCSMHDTGVVLHAVLQHPVESRNLALRFQSFTATPNEALREFEIQTDSKWDVEHRSIAELRKLEEKMWAEKHPVAAVPTLRRIWSTGGTLYEDGWDNAKVGSPKMLTLTDTVELVIAKQTAA